MKPIEQTSATADAESAVRNRPNDFATFANLGSAYMEMSLEDHEYGLACFHVVNGAAEKGLELLETACARGQATPGWLRIDPEFVFIQDHPRFKSLVSGRK
jgi:hypothetical protein